MWNRRSRFEGRRTMSKRRRRHGSRKQRSRPTPKWLMTSADLDTIAQQRCLMVLRVLSGETPVTEAISEAGISRADVLPAGDTGPLRDAEGLGPWRERKDGELAPPTDRGPGGEGEGAGAIAAADAAAAPDDAAVVRGRRRESARPGLAAVLRRARDRRGHRRRQRRRPAFSPAPTGAGGP